jgi:hypothetical protein
MLRSSCPAGIVRPKGRQWRARSAHVWLFFACIDSLIAGFWLIAALRVWWVDLTCPLSSTHSVANDREQSFAWACSERLGREPINTARSPRPVPQPIAA